MASFRSLPPPQQRPATGNLGARRLAALLILIAGAALPAWYAAATAPPPQTRDIHIETYRYGFSPARIHANRGDRLRLTFSTRDTGQSFFFQDYDLHVSIDPGNNLVSVQSISRPNDPAVEMKTVELVAGLPGWQGWLTSKSQFRNHTYNGPLHGTERGDLIVTPNFLLYGGLGLLFAMPLAGLLLAGRGAPGGESRINLFTLFPWLKRIIKFPTFQFNLMLPMLAAFWLIILAGLLGGKVAGRNAAPMIIWVLWLSALIIILVPVFGRIWCTVCPLPMLGELLQRRRLSKDPAATENKTPLRLFGIPPGVACRAEQRLAARAALSAAGHLQHQHRGSAAGHQLDADRPGGAGAAGLVPARAARLLPLPLPHQQLHQPLLHHRPRHGPLRLRAGLRRLRRAFLPHRQHQGLGLPLRPLRGRTRPQQRLRRLHGVRQNLRLR